jgi:hypothetical protein
MPSQPQKREAADPLDITGENGHAGFEVLDFQQDEDPLDIRKKESKTPRMTEVFKRK